MACLLTLGCASLVQSLVHRINGSIYGCFTRAENCSNFVIFSFKASSVNCFLTKLNMFSIGFMSGDRAGIANKRHPAWSNAFCVDSFVWGPRPAKNNLPFWFSPSKTALGNIPSQSLQITFLSKSLCTVHSIQLPCRTIATKKFACQPLIPAFFLIDVSVRPSHGFRHAMPPPPPPHSELH